LPALNFSFPIWVLAPLKAANPQGTIAMLTSKQVEQILAENEAFLSAIQEFQSLGKVSEVCE
jgi:hypothetical protein